ncbi:DUF3817 domain-containing protein [Flagellimonas sp. DF-77]|uniref:DUF3817 domain-containing protein n=1 Tax=Flagellimonas algarum TaxID=3230298 RepID=UPI00339A87A6
MTQLFRAVAILEGITYVLIIGLTMPLKYWADIGQPNKVIGMAHGVLFILFILLSALFSWQNRWGLKRFLVLFLASILPFGTFYADKKYLRNID